jgi:hypothetical protein
LLEGTDLSLFPIDRQVTITVLRLTKPAWLASLHSRAGDGRLEKKVLVQRPEGVSVMELYFKCPVVDQLFSTSEYAMLENYGVHPDGEGGKVLLGRVGLTGSCPLCGGQHNFRVDEVICPLRVADGQ